MEYFIGSIITLITIVVVNKMLRKEVESTKAVKPRVSQSYLYAFLSSYIETDSKPEKKNQSSDFLNKKYVKVVVLENEAYWIHNNQLFRAEYSDGEVDRLSAKQVDTFSMNQKELQKTIYIVEKLREGRDENSGTGDKPF